MTRWWPVSASRRAGPARAGRQGAGQQGRQAGRAGPLGGAVAAYDEVVARFGDAAEPALREQVARALVNKGVSSGELGASAAEVAVYDEVVARFGDAPSPPCASRSL